jgi:hypothetical protein
MFTLWLIVAIVLFGVSTYCIGRFDLDGGDPVGLLWTSLFCSVCWPAVLAVAVVMGPFFGLFWLGDRKREKLKKEKSTDNK